jgi:tetratricopeptide (TPR) repeat protein
MSFNIKHYVAIGLGFAVFAGFAMQRSTATKQPAAFESHAGEFKPLSSFDSTKAEASRIATTKPGIAQVATLQHVSQDLPTGQQVAFDLGVSPNDGSDFRVPDFLDEPEMGLAVNSMDDGGKHESECIESGAEDSNLPIELIAVATLDQYLQQTENRDESTDQDVATTSNEPAIDKPTGQVLVDKVVAGSIIVEPIQDNQSQQIVDVTKPVDSSKDEDWIYAISDDSEQDIATAPKSLESSEVQQVANEVTEVASEIGATRALPLPDAVAQQAVHHIEYGKSLSRRGASFAARQEFYAALRVIAESNDKVAGTNECSRALSQAVLAMKEAKDFVSENTESELLMDVSSITETHRSKIIERIEGQSTSPGEAMRIYFDFAQRQLDTAGGRNVVSTEAFYCLGKLHSVTSQSEPAPGRLDVAKAKAYHHAVLMGDEKDYRSANELGVLMVRSGQLQAATEMFKRSLINRPTPQAWHNLAKTHRRLGQEDLAQLAEEELALLSDTPASSGTIRWVPTTTFNAQAPVQIEETDRVASQPDELTTKPKTTAEKIKAQTRSLGQRLKDLF